MAKIGGKEIESKWLLLLGFIVGCLVIGALIYCCSKDNYADEKKWSCSETGCELTLGGQYDTEEECKKSGCKLKELKKVTFSDNLHTYYYGY